VETHVEVREPVTERDFERYYDLRWRILREPWTDAKESERDEYEQEAIHITAWVEGKLTGVGRVHFISPEEAQVRYMAVEEGYSGQGIGSAILRELEDRARLRGARRMVLNARESAVRFYEKHRYVITDQTSVLFDRIAHWEMRKEL
jgi:GNAT superfamily N-acetyltransferase